MGQPQSKPSKPWFIQPGDHIYCQRKGGLYYHHGIYVGDDMVIHLQGKAKKLEPLPECRKCKDKRVQNGEIAKVCIDCFLRGERPRIYDYGVSLLEFLARKGSAASYQIECIARGIGAGPVGRLAGAAIAVAWRVSKGVRKT
ncbi:hypothetical protein ES319_D08G255200v1 [Gossypium barbadense]|uniref:LRAT domain-containing protein n=1 Tax=Gossypium barbadense TaxID=3634 RepID=A0A5J5QIA9_GOSBA|nr:hypothetical protein ES319_D08G255200v1 [Gossypium barbadense]